MKPRTRGEVTVYPPFRRQPLYWDSGLLSSGPHSVTDLRVLALEPWLGGSHERFLSAWTRHSAHRIQVLGLPARHWRWRMSAGAWALGERILNEGIDRPDVLFVSDYVDLPRLYGHLPRAWRDLPAVLYFHENQLTYPNGPDRDSKRFADDLAPGWANILSCLSADRVIFNSQFHRQDFAHAADRLLARLPKPRPRAQLRAALDEASVVPPGVELDCFPTGPGGEAGSPLRVGFNHRWEHDKDPAAFLHAIRAASARGAKLELILLGEHYERTPPEIPCLLEELQPLIRHCGHASSQADYASLLGSCDLVVSTARHEFYGMALLEGLALGAQPVAPHRLSYPEVLPPELHPSSLYTDPENLVSTLVAAAVEPERYRNGQRRAERSALAEAHSAIKTAGSLDDAVFLAVKRV